MKKPKINLIQIALKYNLKANKKNKKFLNN